MPNQIPIPTMLFVLYLLLITDTSFADAVFSSVNDVFPHYQFTCDPNGKTYETEFSFLQGLGRGFVHAEPHRIFFEYYFPAQHWVGFSTADQYIQGAKDNCSSCYFKDYYPLPSNTNHSNLYPLCIEECLDDTIFVATVNSDERNINTWDLIEFQIIAQKSRKLQQIMYRIPPYKEILEVWGSEYSSYRRNAHFKREIIPIGDKEFIHAKFWREYDFAPPNNISQAEWKPFVIGPYPNSFNLSEPDTFCFVSIGSFYGGEYPYDDALNGLPGFYIDTQHLTNIHCYKRDDIKVDCGQDWSFLTQRKTKALGPLITATTTTTTTTTTSTTSTSTTTSTTQPTHGEDCCSAISQISYEDINCFNISKSDHYIQILEKRWKKEQCGKQDNLPTDLNDHDAAVPRHACYHLWALFNQIHGICYKYTFTIKKMKVYNYLKKRGGFECFNKNTDECKKKKGKISKKLKINFNNFVYNEDMDDVDYTDLLVTTSDTGKSDTDESELAAMEDDGGLTMTSLAIVALIICLLQ